MSQRRKGSAQASAPRKRAQEGSRPAGHGEHGGERGPSPKRASGGNLATLRALGIRAKVSVSEPSDSKEREADRAADAFAARAPLPGGGVLPCAAPAPAPRSSGGGEPLAPELRGDYEEFFGKDLSGARIHTGESAHAAARSVAATAFAHGNDVYFQNGRFDPASHDGRKLLAHELAHVVQGDAAGARLHRQVDPRYQVDDPYVGGAAPERIYFERGSTALLHGQMHKLNLLKWGADRQSALLLKGLATEDEIAADPALPEKRAAAVSAELGQPTSFLMPLAHEGLRIVIPGNHADPTDPDLRFNRGVDIVVVRAGAAPAAPPLAAGAPACDPAAVAAARTTALGWIADTRREVRDRPVATSPAGADQELYFATREASTARRIDHNLGIIAKELERLTEPGKYVCDATDPKCIGGTIAFNRLGVMYFCPSFNDGTPEAQASVIIHEAAHSTPSLRITGLRNKDGAKDIAYRFERLLHTLGDYDPDYPLLNADSYAMFVVARRAPAALAGPGQSPAADPAPSGFAAAADARKSQLALGLAQMWIRNAGQWLTLMHVFLREKRGTAIPDLGFFGWYRVVLQEMQKDFPPILSQPNVRGDDLIMIAGVLDRFREMRRLLMNPVAIVSGGTTSLSGSSASLTLTVDAAFLAAGDDIARGLIVLEKVIEFMGPAQVGAAMRPGYGDFAQGVRRMLPP